MKLYLDNERNLVSRLLYFLHLEAYIVKRSQFVVNL